ncbi:MAG: hypothetical protein ACLFV7_11475 [Phycisphaerae bacterium]
MVMFDSLNRHMLAPYGCGSLPDAETEGRMIGLLTRGDAKLERPNEQYQRLGLADG